MKLKIVMFLIIKVMVSNTLFAQTKVKTFSKGDIIPPSMILGKMVNHKRENAKFSDFRGKLVILDFWATHCSPCVAGLPRMDSLQRKYGKKIAIIPITSEKYDIIQDYFKKKKFQLPSVVEDKILSDVFPQTALDLHVWIDQKGKIIGTTSGEDVNFKTVDEYFKSGKVNAKERIDIVGGFDENKPLFVNGNGGTGDSFLGRSIISNKFLIGEQTGGRIAKQSTLKKNGEYMIEGLKMWNGHPTNLFFPILFGLNVTKMKPHLLFKEVANGNIIKISESQDMKGQYKDIDNYLNIRGDGVLNYELILPFPGVEENLFLRKYLLDDINRYFDFTIRIDKRKIPSWIIFKREDLNTILNNDTIDSDHFIYDDTTYAYLKKVRNLSVGDFINYLQQFYYMSPPMFDETGLSSEKVNLNLNMKYNEDKANYKTLNLEEWRAAFQRNGLDIKVEDREVEVMVFKKKETPTK